MADVQREAAQRVLRTDVHRLKNLGASIVFVKAAFVIKTPSAAITPGMKSVLTNAPIVEDAVLRYRALRMDVHQRKVQDAPTALAKTVPVN